jgi:hypothetical protein
MLLVFQIVVSFSKGEGAAGQQYRVTPSYEAVARSPKGCLSTGCEHGRQNLISLPESRRVFKKRALGQHN